MNSRIYKLPNELPETAAIFNLINKNNQSLFVGVAENLRKNVENLLANKSTLRIESVKVQTFDVSEKDLIKLYSKILRRKNPLYNFSIANQNLYPHFKITREKFPRIRITRRIETDEAEYFGGFLPETGARFLFGFLIDSFGLRGCDIPIDGSFDLPCPQFYRKKCVAPCVEKLCDEKSYLENVNLARLFLDKHRAKLNQLLLEKIKSASNELDFETAAKNRDLLAGIDSFFDNKDRQYWLDDTVDTFELKSENKSVRVYLVTQRKRKILGRLTFEFENKLEFSDSEMIEQILWQFYQFHAPGEIIVPENFQTRGFLTANLNSRPKNETKISIVKKAQQRKTTGRALKRTVVEYEINSLKPRVSVEKIKIELAKEFFLKAFPERFEAYDVAHISGTDFVGAKSVWDNGRFLAAEYEFHFLDEKSELAALGKTMEKCLKLQKKTPVLVVIDGGKSQLQVALKVVKQLKKSNITVIAAVKPPKKHNEISRFLMEGGRFVTFKPHSEGFRVLLKLRDEAHRTANYIHRTKRETAHFLELFGTLPFLSERERYDLLQKFGSLSGLRNASKTELESYLGKKNGTLLFGKLRNKKMIEPFIVPIRYDDANGEAENLQPLFVTKN